MNPFNRALIMNYSLSIDLDSPRRSRWAALSLVLLAGFAGLFLASCKKGGADAKPANVDYYTCTMHPSVKKQSPTDKCPICSMDLTPVLKKGDGAAAAHAEHAGHAGHTAEGMPQSNTATKEEKPGEFSVSVERQQQIGVSGSGAVPL